MPVARGTSLRLLRERPLSAFALAQAIWGREASSQVFLVLSEVLGHLDLLLHKGLIAERIADERVIFEPV
jgi:hypothetical protein